MNIRKVSLNDFEALGYVKQPIWFDFVKTFEEKS
jgi:hypothetical protein